ncbi:MAG: pallilysin-related adhesin [Treponema sp.]|nr:pallilysin-related adhesin [Treponema sp.]
MIFVLVGLGIGALVLFPGLFHEKRKLESYRTRLVTPDGAESLSPDGESPEDVFAREAGLELKVPLDEGDICVGILSGDFDSDSREEQIAAYRRQADRDSPVYVAYIDNEEGGYRRVWSAATAASGVGAVTLSMQDLCGDRVFCFLVAGLNSRGEHTLTVFRRAPGQTGEAFMRKIAELSIEGTITVKETARSLAYQQGRAQGAAFALSARGRDMDSANLLDQVEITYLYNAVRGIYEQSALVRIPGTQIEQTKVRELLSGAPGVFERFIEGLWYHVSPQGTLDSRQYLYFNPKDKELIFYGDDAQQVFTWQRATPTRSGLYINTQNVSVTTLRRFVDIDLESLDRIRVKVNEDVRLRIGVNTRWDGSYRRASRTASPPPPPAAPAPTLDASYEGALWKITFRPDGTCEQNKGGVVLKGKYAFFSIDSKELLELRLGGERETYLVGTAGTAGAQGGNQVLILNRVRIGAQGIVDMRESPITLTLLP